MLPAGRDLAIAPGIVGSPKIGAFGQRQRLAGEEAMPGVQRIALAGDQPPDPLGGQSAAHSRSLRRSRCSRRYRRHQATMKFLMARRIVTL